MTTRDSHVERLEALEEFAHIVENALGLDNYSSEALETGPLPEDLTPDDTLITSLLRVRTVCEWPTPVYEVLGVHVACDVSIERGEGGDE